MKATLIYLLVLKTKTKILFKIQVFSWKEDEKV